MCMYVCCILGLQQIFDSFGYSLEFWYSNSKINIRYLLTCVLCNVQLEIALFTCDFCCKQSCIALSKLVISTNIKIRSLIHMY